MRASTTPRTWKRVGPYSPPESGYVSLVRTSPFSYGRVLHFKGASAPGFSRIRADSARASIPPCTPRNMRRSITTSPSTPRDSAFFPRGDTLTFTGHGHRNPTCTQNPSRRRHGHLPCGSGVVCYDTIPPQILGAFTWYKITSASRAIARSKSAASPCPENRRTTSAFKIADYSRTPLDNPMSVRPRDFVRRKKSCSSIFGYAQFQ